MAEDIVITIQRCLAGDEDAWNALHREYSWIAMAFLRWKFPDVVNDHDDIIQKVFTRLLSAGLKSFKGTTKYEFLPYFKTIVKNEALRSIEERKRRKTVSLHNENSENEDGSPMTDIPDPHVGSRPDRRAEAQELLALIAATLKEYALVDQEVFLLKKRGYRDREISAILDIPMGTVAVKYTRIKSRLREKFDDHGSDH